MVDLQTKLEATKLQQEILERQLKNVLNDQENTLVIGKGPRTLRQRETNLVKQKSLSSSYEGERLFWWAKVHL